MCNFSISWSVLICPSAKVLIYYALCLSLLVLVICSWPALSILLAPVAGWRWCPDGEAILMTMSGCLFRCLFPVSILLSLVSTLLRVLLCWSFALNFSWMMGVIQGLCWKACSPKVACVVVLIFCSQFFLDDGEWFRGFVEKPAHLKSSGKKPFSSLGMSEF
jgi:hypothetical protein